MLLLLLLLMMLMLMMLMLMLMMVMVMVMQVCVAHRRSIQLYTVFEDRVIALKDVSVAESPLTLVMLIIYYYSL